MTVTRNPVYSQKSDIYRTMVNMNPASGVLIEEVDIRAPAFETFELFRHRALPFILDSGMDALKLGRYSFMGADPFLIFSSRGTEINIRDSNGARTCRGNPFDVLGQLLAEYNLAVSNAPVPLLGGAVGYFSYDLGRLIENLPARAVDDLNLPECYFGFYDAVVAVDHKTGKCFIISTGFPEQEEKRIRRARERMSEIKSAINGITRLNGEFFTGDQSVSVPQGQEIRSNFTRTDYLRAVAKARQYIIDGDIFEVNLSQRFESDLNLSPYDLYLRLRKINPAPFAAYLDFGEPVIVSSSPERFLRLTGDRVETRPIKGTIRRGGTPEEDRANARKLLESEKDHAENMMIVDLERNDLGRVCRFGSVKVTELAILETYPTVFHLTSTVIGQLEEDVTRMDLLKATFPGGSITGAPKVRSMEIIDELEPTRRSVYTGSIGYLSFDGNMDLNIAIRTFLIKGKKAYFQVGGAVVYDSEPEAEFQETLDKGRALFAALNQGTGII